MEKREYAGLEGSMIENIPFAEKIARWPWIQDKRVKKRFLKEEELKLLDKNLTCLLCGQVHEGDCPQKS
ncbi:hypothetical protein QBE54_05920 [Thermatribacter velox]|uniref:Uncharacterized protein n=1 Tax=Thermatribacter velox TaxID=3039681 RepID=A0ABZ2YBM3_9BACT